MGQLVSLKEAAKALNCSERFLYQRLATLPHYRMSRKGIRFDLAELREAFRVQGHKESN